MVYNAEAPKEDQEDRRGKTRGGPDSASSNGGCPVPRAVGPSEPLEGASRDREEGLVQRVMKTAVKRDTAKKK